jgi:hypothetical protein
MEITAFSTLIGKGGISMLCGIVRSVIFVSLGPDPDPDPDICAIEYTGETRNLFT